MLSAQLEGVEAGIIAFPKGNHILGRVAFNGKATGRVCLRIPPEIARLAAAKILGATVEEMGNDAEVDDVIGELTNMVVGNFKSNLCDAGLDCKLSPPEILRTDEFQLNAERMGFRAPDVNLFVDIVVDPWTSTQS